MGGRAKGWTWERNLYSNFIQKKSYFLYLMMKRFFKVFLFYYFVLFYFVIIM